jgi:Icc protein
MTPLSGETALITPGSARILQLSDTHLMAESGGRLVGIDTDQSLAAVCRLIAGQERVDALLLTGDLAGDESEKAYERLCTLIEPLGIPSFWLPGNHDAIWQASHPLAHYFRRNIGLSHWDIVMLNTQQPGAVAGLLADSELLALSKAVQQAIKTDRPLLVATHHPLMPVGCAWLDEQNVRNASEALDLLIPLGNRAVVVSGHVHQDSVQAHRGVQCLTAPSTCVQFAPGSAQFQVDDVAPGCRLLALHEDGQWEADVLRVVDETFRVDLTSRGYA